MRRKNFKYFIVTDDRGKPMAWDEYSKQLCYCTNTEWLDEHHPVKAYTKAKAEKFINKSIATKKKFKLSETEYRLMPFEPTLRISKKKLLSVK